MLLIINQTFGKNYIKSDMLNYVKLLEFILFVDILDRIEFFFKLQYLSRRYIYTFGKLFLKQDFF